jgi:hypothetical protein
MIKRVRLFTLKWVVENSSKGFELVKRGNDGQNSIAWETQGVWWRHLLDSESSHGRIIIDRM